MVEGFRPVIGKYLGQPVQGQTNPLPSALAQQGGTSVATAQQMQPAGQAQPPAQGNQPAVLSRGLPDMQTTPRSALQGAFQQPHQQPLPVNSGTPGNAPVQQNPFLNYLNQMFGPGAQRQTNLRLPSYLRYLPVAPNQAPNPINSTQNPRNVTIPPVSVISGDVTSQIGAPQLPNATPYTQNTQQQGGGNIPL